MSSRRKVRPGAPGSSQRSRPASAASGRSAVSAASALRARPTSATELRSGGSGSTGRGPCDRFAQPTLSSRQKENAVPQLHALEAGSQSMPVVRRRSERVRPRPARPNSKQFNLSGSGWELTEAGRRYSKESNLRHALGGWNAVPKHKTTASLWEHRWVSTLPDPSFDVDGDGIVSNEDLLVANEFDKDGNGTLDAHEKRELRRQLARKGVAAFYNLPHGPHLGKISRQLNKSLLHETPREMGLGENIDPDSDSWHLRMAALSNKTKVAAHFNSETMKACITHSDTEAKPINLMADMVGKTIKASRIGPTNPMTETPRPKSAAEKQKLRKLFDSIDTDQSGYLDRAEIAVLAARTGKTMSTRQLDDAMHEMDIDGSGEVDFEEFADWYKSGVMAPPQGSDVFRMVSEKIERKVKNVRTIFRQWDENKDGTVSHHEFRTGLRNIGIELTEPQFQQLIETVDEDHSNEIDYNEFAKSGMMGGKFFAARAGGYSGCRTRTEMVEKRRAAERVKGQASMNSFWQRRMGDPRITIGQLCWEGGAGK